MKHRYIVRTFVEASTPSEAIRLAKKTTPHEAYLDDRYWEKQGFPLTNEESKRIGFK